MKDQTEGYLEVISNMGKEIKELRQGISKDNPKPKRIDVIKLGENDPVIHNCLYFWHEGLFTFEEALIFAVQTLLRQKNDLVEQNQKLLLEKMPKGLYLEDLSGDTDVKLGE